MTVDLTIPEIRGNARAVTKAAITWGGVMACILFAADASPGPNTNNPSRANSASIAAQLDRFKEPRKRDLQCRY